VTRVIITCICIFTGICVKAQTTCDSLHLIKQRVYGFKPATLTDSMREHKSQELDVFWKVARSNPSDASRCLRSFIKSESKDPFFCFDASLLLLRLDTKAQYLPTVVLGISKCDLDDIRLSSYLDLCFYLGKKGQDIGILTIKLMSYPDAQIFLPKHALTLDAIQASIFLINTMPTATAERVLISAITKGNATARHNASVILNLLATDRGDRMLKILMDNKQIEDSTINRIRLDRSRLIVTTNGTVSRTKVLEALDDVPFNMSKSFFGFAGDNELIGSACKVLTRKDIHRIRNARLKATPGLSDEALSEYFALSTILTTVRSKKSH
jgi:hypothetical protein